LRLIPASIIAMSINGSEHKDISISGSETEEDVDVGMILSPPSPSSFLIEGVGNVAASSKGRSRRDSTKPGFARASLLKKSAREEVDEEEEEEDDIRLTWVDRINLPLIFFKGKVGKRIFRSLFWFIMFGYVIKFYVYFVNCVFHSCPYSLWNYEVVADTFMGIQVASNFILSPFSFFHLWSSIMGLVVYLIFYFVFRVIAILFSFFFECCCADCLKELDNELLEHKKSAMKDHLKKKRR
jgi:hypothetical protein